MFVSFIQTELKSMKVIISAVLLTTLMVIALETAEGRRPLNSYLDTLYEELMQDPAPDRAAYTGPTASRKTQVPNCKKKGETCNDSLECCHCTTTGGYYSCMICSSATGRKECFI